MQVEATWSGRGQAINRHPGTTVRRLRRNAAASAAQRRRCNVAALEVRLPSRGVVVIAARLRNPEVDSAVRLRRLEVAVLEAAGRRHVVAGVLALLAVAAVDRRLVRALRVVVVGRRAAEAAGGVAAARAFLMDGTHELT